MQNRSIGRTVSDVVYVLDAIVGVDPNDQATVVAALLAEFKSSLNAYLKDLVSSLVRSLAEVIVKPGKISIPNFPPL